jgi:hypothetical protein
MAKVDLLNMLQVLLRHLLACCTGRLQIYGGWRSVLPQAECGDLFKFKFTPFVYRYGDLTADDIVLRFAFFSIKLQLELEAGVMYVIILSSLARCW